MVTAHSLLTKCLQQDMEAAATRIHTTFCVNSATTATGRCSRDSISTEVWDVEDSDIRLKTDTKPDHTNLHVFPVC